LIRPELRRVGLIRPELRRLCNWSPIKALMAGQLHVLRNSAAIKLARAGPAFVSRKPEAPVADNPGREAPWSST